MHEYSRRHTAAALVVALSLLLVRPAKAQLDYTGPEFSVNSYTTGQQILPRISHTSNGEFVVVWTSYGPDESSGAVVAQRFDADASKQGKEFVVNTYT
ncbi:MAG: hypothetical protein E4H00_08550, partial [Myxococcales bacterium]